MPDVTVDAKPNRNGGRLRLDVNVRRPRSKRHEQQLPQSFNRFADGFVRAAALDLQLLPALAEHAKIFGSLRRTGRPWHAGNRLHKRGELLGKRPTGQRARRQCRRNGAAIERRRWKDFRLFLDHFGRRNL